MKTHLSVHTEPSEKGQLFGHSILNNVNRENANSIHLRFGDVSLTVYNLNVTDAELLMSIARMSDEQRAELLEYAEIIERRDAEAAA